MTIPVYTGTVPNIGQTQPDFDQNTQDAIDYQLTLAPALNEFAEQLNNYATNSTSATSLLIGTGSKSLTVEVGKSYFAGQYITIAYTTTPTNQMRGVITSYDSGTGALVVLVDYVMGSGTYAAWSVSLGSIVLQTEVLYSYINGLTLSTAGSSATMTIAAGQCADSTNLAMLSLASAIGKTTSAWAVGTGNGGLDTGSIANNTWYHFFLIKRTDTNVVDVLISLSPTAPTLPANYTYFRRIGSGRTNGSAQWTSFVQNKNIFRWSSIVQDINASNPGSSAVTRTLTVPTGVVVEALIQIGLSAAEFLYISPLSVTDETSDVNHITLRTSGGASSTYRCITNTSSQIRSRLNTGSAVTLTINTEGWIDYFE